MAVVGTEAATCAWVAVHEFQHRHHQCPSRRRAVQEDVAGQVEESRISVSELE